MAEVRVGDPGFLVTIQDARGRPGLGRFGIPPGGALDAIAARLANRLVGNAGDEPVLEIAFGGLALHWSGAALVALGGANLGAEVDGLRLPPGHSVRVAAGATMRFGAAGGGSPTVAGARAYLAVGEGFAVESVLGSASTDTRSGFGGIAGRALEAGDVIRFAGRATGPLRSVVGPTHLEVEARRPLMIVPTPISLGWFTRAASDTVVGVDWVVQPDSDRSGIRLSGPRLEARVAGIPSLGVPVGSVQVPPSGDPIVTMADGPVTGGYPVIGVVPRFEHGRLAQAIPGDVLRFAWASVRDARLAGVDAAQRELGVEVELGDFAAGWAR